MSQFSGRALIPVLFLVLSLTTLVPVSAVADSYSWTLSEALSAARRHDPELRRRALDVVEARGEERSSWNLLLPSLELGSSLSRSMFDEGPESPWSTGLSASASLGLSPDLDQRVRSRTQALDAAVLDQRRAYLALTRRVRERFYAALLNERRIEIARRNVELAEQQLEQVRALYERGRASELDLLDARAAAISRRPELLSRRQVLASELSALKELTGLSPDDELRLHGAIGSPEVELADEEIVRTVLANSLELQAAELTLDRRETSRSITFRGTKLPRLSASYSYGPRISPAFDAELWNDPETWRTGSVSFRLTVPLDPLIPRSAGDNEVRAADRAVDAARIDLEEQEIELRRRAADLSSRLSVSREKLEILEEAAEIAAARYEETLAVYESGGVGLLEVDDARADREDAEIDLLQERYNIVMTLVELDALAGGAILAEDIE
ncbi:MAG: TolC family protein [Spirochaetia bacterium]